MLRWVRRRLIRKRSAPGNSSKVTIYVTCTRTEYGVDARRQVINGSFAFSERVQPLSNPVRSIVCGRVPKNRAYNGVPL